MSWKEAFEECKLFGGWLVNIGSQSEQNCLLELGRTQEYNEWFWTDGICIVKTYNKIDCKVKVSSRLILFSFR